MGWAERERRKRLEKGIWIAKVSVTLTRLTPMETNPQQPEILMAQTSEAQGKADSPAGAFDDALAKIHSLSTLIDPPRVITGDFIRGVGVEPA